MQANEPTALSYLARRGVAAQWRGFLRALVETLDAHLDPASRDSLLRTVGTKLGANQPLPPCGSLAELEARMNEVLAAADWGWADLALDPNDRMLVITHCAAPAVGTGADPSGSWIGAVLEGLYGAWLGAQPGAEPSLVPRRAGTQPGMITFRYGRG